MPKLSQYAQGTPNWVDLQTTDQSAAKQFYASLLGWSYDDNPMPQGGVYSMATVNGETVAGDRADAARRTRRQATDVEHLHRGGRRRGSGREGGIRGRAGAYGTRRYRGSRPDGLRRRSDRPGRGAVAGQPPHRRDAGRRAGR